MQERQEPNENTSLTCGLKRSHAHGFDLDKNRTHTRTISAKERKKINEKYTCLDILPFKECKNPLVMSEIYQLESNDADSDSNLKLLLNIALKPDIKHYYDGQKFDDNLFVDVSSLQFLSLTLTYLEY